VNLPQDKDPLISRVSCFASLAVIAVTCVMITTVPFNFWNGLSLREVLLLGLATVVLVCLPLWFVIAGMRKDRTERLEPEADTADGTPLGTIESPPHGMEYAGHGHFTNLQGDQQGWLAAVSLMVIGSLLIITGALLLVSDSILWGMALITFGLVMGVGAVTVFRHWANFGKVVVKASATTVAEGDEFFVAVFSSRQLRISRLQVELVWQMYLPEDDEEPAEERTYPVADLRNLVSTCRYPVAFLKVKAPGGGLPGEKVENQWRKWGIRIRMDLEGKTRMVEDFHLC